MLKITMLGIALAAIALTGAMYVADAKTVPLSLAQERNAIQIHDVECMDTHVLMQTPSGTPACIFTEHAFALEGRGFAFVSGSFDVFPTGSSGQSITHGIGVPSTVPVISMSRLPNVNETAIVEITYTNMLSVNITDTEENRIGTAHIVGWSIGSGFEVVNSGGLEYDTPQVNSTNSAAARYTAFTPLDVGESIAYRIEVKAVKEGYSYISSIGYLHSDTQIHLYLDDEETLHYQEHRTRYPEMHTVPERTSKYESAEMFPPLTDEERAAAIEYVQPSRETLADFFEAYFAGNDPEEIGAAMDFVQNFGSHLNYTLPDLKQILGAAGYTDNEI